MPLLIRIVDVDSPLCLAILYCIFLYGIVCKFVNLKQIKIIIIIIIIIIITAIIIIIIVQYLFHLKYVFNE